MRSIIIRVFGVIGVLASIVFGILYLAKGTVIPGALPLSAAVALACIGYSLKPANKEDAESYKNWRFLFVFSLVLVIANLVAGAMQVINSIQ